VGTYPSGASPCGAQDMAGNVWEWTSSAYKRYPNDDRQGSQRADAIETRVLRGGSCFDNATAARAAFRLPAQPDRTDIDSGFRVLCAVPSS
jgi:formylglycine-generating enzyme required for sulfatase activity